MTGASNPSVPVRFRTSVLPHPLTPLHKRGECSSPSGRLGGAFFYGCSVQAAHRHSAPDWGFQPLRRGSIPRARATTSPLTPRHKRGECSSPSGRLGGADIFCGSGVTAAHKPSKLDGVPPVRKSGFDSRLPLQKLSQSDGVNWMGSIGILPINISAGSRYTQMGLIGILPID